MLPFRPSLASGRSGRKFQQEVTNVQGLAEAGGGGGEKWKSLVVEFSMFVAWFAIGLCVFHFEEDMHVITAIYVQAQMLTTIGYGDVTVQTKDSTKIFLAFYALVTLFVVATLVIQAIEKIADAAGSGMSSRLAGGEDSVKQEVKALKKMMFMGLATFLAIMSGTIFFGTVEKCTCSYGESIVEGCDPDNCEQTGGYEKTYLDAFYMSCISLTTVGFGDFAPKSEAGRVFACFWMIFGCVLLALCQGSISTYVSERSKAQARAKLDMNSLFDAVDIDGSGQLDRFEFLTFALLEYGLISIDDVNEIGKEFEKLDADGSGKLDREEVMQKFSSVRKTAELPLRSSLLAPRGSTEKGALRKCSDFDDEIMLKIDKKPKKVIDKE